MFCEESQNHRLAWVGRDLKGHLVPSPAADRAAKEREKGKVWSNVTGRMLFVPVNQMFSWKHRVNLCTILSAGDEIQLVCLPHMGEDFESGMLCMASGWGRVSEGE